jgi:hypothetical protein
MQLESTLQQFPLSEIMAMMVASLVSGGLEIGSPSRPIGRLFCRDGRLYHAVAGDRTGIAAIRRLAEERDAPFRFIAGMVCEEATLPYDSEVSVGLAKRTEQLWSQVRPYLPSLEWVPVLCENSTEEQVRLDQTHWPALATVDGQRSVAEIAALLGYEPLEVAVALSDLIARGLVLVEPPARRGLGPVSVPAPEGDFLERLVGDRSAALQGAARPARVRRSGLFGMWR